MSASTTIPVNPLAPHVLPWFLTAPGDTDVLYVITTLLVMLIVVLLGVGFFWLHSLPERMGHRKLQFEVVAVLGLVSLFTHMHIFWIIGLVLAMIDLPDFIGPQRRIARAVEKIAGIPGEAGQSETPAAAALDRGVPATTPPEHG
ncbi:MAG: hypothetical protein IOC82_16300 [Aestuariivirga sp.]|uniref:hypothetical protein n=1 Tax=Aestuariivirga sp. TaxID=2650926 RepID=UPI0025C4168C|nr:hypothetical protein [Aestuariivirga sp.]MCA3562579.1 hypothetical protein [Aestuariivirga sp.]